jgi:transcriptional regulatory protein GAL4
MNRGETLPSPVDYPTTYSAIIAQANLAMIANRIYINTLSASVRRDQVEDRVAIELENQLAMWRASLPDYFVALRFLYGFVVPGLWYSGKSRTCD